jgi:N-acetylmuramic acid 6-phosphate etherase
VTESIWDLPTERRNPRTIGIDQLSAVEIVRLIVAEDMLVPALVAESVPQLGQAVDIIARRLTVGGRLHYFGAGTSGRIALMDAAELVPTYGIAPDLVVAHQAGGQTAMSAAREGVEDDDAQGERDAATLTGADFAIGISASGRTPYVAGALRTARQVRAGTMLITSNPAAPIARHAELTITVDTGPEVIAGSTRMKAGTAQKLVLNCISTAVMILLGRTYSNLMVTVERSNGKLSERAVRILADATGLDPDRCRAALAEAGDSLPAALVVLLCDVPPQVAAGLLDRGGGSVRAALELHATEAPTEAPNEAPNEAPTEAPNEAQTKP